jgi:hypothetical protein
MSSSVSHYSTALSPDELMEPFYTGPNRNLTLTADLLQDVGWRLAVAAVPALPAGARLLLVLALAAVSFGVWRARRRHPTWPRRPAG